MTKKFNPEDYGFSLINNYNCGCEGLSFYEFKNKNINGLPNYLRYNTYLSKDEDYITVWTGFLDSFGLEASISKFQNRECFSHLFDSDYSFKGYVGDDNDAKIIFKSLRFNNIIAQELDASGDKPIMKAI